MDRRFQAYCVGAFKSGTHSVAAMFRSSYRAAHEPKPKNLIPFLLKKHAGTITDDECRSFLRSRDEALFLEMESNALLVPVIEQLVALFPRATFILTIRDCYSFADSMINHRLTPRLSRFLHLKSSSLWKKITDIEFQTQGSAHQPGEEILAEYGLHPLRGYFAAWATHNERVIAAVPPERLLIVRTKDIGSKIAEIASFVGADPKLLDSRSSHAYRGGKKYELLRGIDPALLEETVHTYCKPLMDRFFPEIRSLADALGGSFPA